MYNYYRQPQTTDDTGVWMKSMHVTQTRYEYRCPYCGTVNVRYGPTVRIVCSHCGRTFYSYESR